MLQKLEAEYAHAISSGVENSNPNKCCSKWNRLGGVALVGMSLAAVWFTCASMNGSAAASATPEIFKVAEPLVISARDYQPKKKCAPKVIPVPNAVPVQAYVPPQIVGQKPVEVTPVSTEYAGKAPEKVTYLAQNDMTGNVTYTHTNPKQDFLYLDSSYPGFVNASCNGTYVTIQSSNLTASLADLDAGDHLLIPLDFPSCGQQGMINGTIATVPGYRIVQNVTVIDSVNGIILVGSTIDDMLAQCTISIHMESKPQNSNINRRWDRTGSHDFKFDYPLQWGKNFDWSNVLSEGASNARSNIDVSMDTHFLYHVEWGMHITIKWFKVDYSFSLGGNMDFSLNPSMKLDGRFAVKGGIIKYTPVASTYNLWNWIYAGIYASVDVNIDIAVSGKMNVTLPVKVTQDPWKLEIANNQFLQQGGSFNYDVQLGYGLDIDGKSVSPSITVMPGVGVGVGIGSSAFVYEAGFKSNFTDTLSVSIPAKNDCTLAHKATYEGDFIINKLNKFPANADSKMSREVVFQLLLAQKVLDDRCLARSALGKWNSGNVTLVKGVLPVFKQKKN
ncbi:hypothetical protein HDU77_003035 [Chytriomyces hyalinus]|nr:hypothetical protein HDU77_003035 [Chytriomyces hyalinus]